jgi:hypothetical protein
MITFVDKENSYCFYEHTPGAKTGFNPQWHDELNDYRYVIFNKNSSKCPFAFSDIFPDMKLVVSHGCEYYVFNDEATAQLIALIYAPAVKQ